MAEKPHEHADTAPDPDEDDLDDLDDVLDEFQPSQPPAKPSAPTASGPGRPAGVESSDGRQDATSADPPGPGVDPDLAKQLEAGVSNLISQLDSDPEMQKEFEKMMQELIGAGAAPSDEAAAEHLSKASEAVGAAPSTTAAGVGEDRNAGSSSSNKAGTGAAKDDFQSTIRRTMERMQASGDAATAAAGEGGGGSGGGSPEDDLLAAMMRELGAGGAGGDGADGDGDFNKMLLNMMAQLTHKEILYEPMKELHQGFPAWLAKNGAATPKDELARYEEQQRLVADIVARFERSGYSDDNADDREYIVDKMQQMQAAGSPPADLVGDMNAAQEALGDLDAGCPTQ